MSAPSVSTPATTAYSIPPADPAGDAAESSRKGSASADPSYHALTVSSYVFNAGYMNQQWADVQLAFFDQSIKLHRLILSRSPYLAQIMINYQPGASIHLTFPDDNITAESVHIALHHLYSPSYHLVNASNARSVLASAYLFEGMPELVHHAYTVCRDSIDQSSIVGFVHWLYNSAARPTLVNGQGQAGIGGQSANGAMFGSVTIQNGLATAPSSDSSEAWKEEDNGRYGEWSSRLRQDVFDYLIRTLPESVADSQPLSANPTLLAVYAQLPYDLFKHCVEHPSFPVQPTQSRFAFAKKAIAMRKKQALAAQTEESVVLAIASGQGAVHITRKPKKARTALWKVEG